MVFIQPDLIFSNGQVQENIFSTTYFNEMVDFHRKWGIKPLWSERNSYELTQK